MGKMNDKEITQFIQYYIGVDSDRRLHGIPNGAKLREFYYVDCDLEIEPSHNIATADEFERILRTLSPQYQARVLRAGLEEFFENGDYGLRSPQEKLLPRLEVLAARLESESTIIENVSPQSPSESVRLALEEAEDLIRRGRISSAVDRTHTALHAHFKHICDEGSISYPQRPKIKRIFEVLRERHRAFECGGTRAQDIKRILDNLADIIDAVSPIRNRASLSLPPEDDLLKEPEATLAINAMRSVFHYVEGKLSEHADAERRAIKYRRIDKIPFEDTTRSSVDDIPF